MKLTSQYPELQTLIEKMGAPASNWSLTTAALDPRQKILNALETGIEITPEEIDVGPGSLLTYKGEQVIVYIKDTRASREVLAHTPEATRRFHLSDCTTLREMKEKGRFERYVVTQRQDGHFKVDWFEHETGERGEMESALKVCKNCLAELNYETYKTEKSKRTMVWSSFDISSFLREYSTFFTSKPSRTELTAKIDHYVSNWSSISQETRNRREWECEKCGVSLKGNRGLLHVHHINGVRTDNKDSNLQVLCAICHSEQPMHGHMKVNAEHGQTIRRLRIEQEIRR